MTSTSRELAKTYRPADVEPRVLERWLAAKAFHPDPAAPGKPYSIVIPPPNVTAALHLGHALNNTVQDVLIRHHRMLGCNTLWMVGTDHAGIATQTIVDKRLQAEGQPALKDYKRMEAAGENGREQFIAKVQAWKDEYEQRITEQLRAMGCSCDWDRQRFTMDPVCAAAVREAFFQFFKDGLIYRGKRLVNWDPATQTALADDEVEMEEVDGHFWYLRYPIVEGAKGSRDQGAEEGTRPLDPSAPRPLSYVTVATTRPETMLGDTAVAINPRDPRAAALRGKFVKLPIVNRVIPIIEDEHVVLPDPDSTDAKARYASGFLKVTPAHDPNDYEIGQRHEDEITKAGNPVNINVMAPDASISLDDGWRQQEPQQAYNPDLRPLLGLSREDARKAIVDYFRGHDLLEEVRPYRHSVGHSYRSHVAIEPYLSDQWYVAVTKPTQRLGDDDTPVAGTTVPRNSLAGAALLALGNGKSEISNLKSQSEISNLKFTPERYAKTFRHWHENLRDWCISRQLWWGHRIPVWSNPVQSPVTGDNVGAALDKFTVENRIASLSHDYLPLDDKQRRGVLICVRNEHDQELINFLERNGFTRDPDVLDTWFSSGLWPLSTMGWPNPGAFPEQFPEGDAVLNKWNPTSTLCTAREIITLWVSRMVMFNLYFTGEGAKGPRGQGVEEDRGQGVEGSRRQGEEASSHQTSDIRHQTSRLPFHDVFIHSMIQDGQGRKMSKSLGNGVDPMDIIHSHGSDAMRFTLTQMTTHTQDVRMPVTRDSETGRNTSDKFDLGRNFANKLWNAVRFALGNLSFSGSTEGAPSGQPLNGQLQLPDRWILARLAGTIAEVDAALRDFRFADYAQTLYDFFWRDLCDWYIEAVKLTIRDNESQKRVLAACIDASLRLLHPVMPFITETLWEHLNETVPGDRSLPGLALEAGELLVTARWPRAEQTLIDEDAQRTFELIQQVVTAARQVRTQYAVPPKQTVDISAKAPPAIAQKLLAHEALIGTLANISGREVGPRVDKPADAAVAVTGDIELYLHGLVDPDTERTRLQKRSDDLGKTIATLRGRLSNESYIKKAPAKLVDESREQLAAAERELESVQGQLATL